MTADDARNANWIPRLADRILRLIEAVREGDATPTQGEIEDLVRYYAEAPKP